MISSLVDQLKHALPVPMARSGMVSSGQGMAPGGDDLMTIIIAIILGAFCGLLAGFIVARVMRFVGFVLGRDLGGSRWVIVGLTAGAVVFGYLAATDDDD